MAERERRSKPRKDEPVEEEEEHYNWWHLGMWLVGAIAVIEVMYLVSTFLSSSSGAEPWFYYTLAGTVLVTALFWLAGWLADRKK